MYAIRTITQTRGDMLASGLAKGILNPTLWGSIIRFPRDAGHSTGDGIRMFFTGIHVPVIIASGVTRRSPWPRA
jgi:hypothetical protein